MSDTWHASVGLFSGRPDPTWTLDRTAVDAFVQRWAALPPDEHAGAWRVPQLGYRGCRIRCGDREWHFFACRAQLVEAGRAIESRCDPGRQLERWILDTAPRSLRPLLAGCLART